MKNKGFTLIELLAVIIILSIIAIITVPKITEKINEVKISLAKQSALNYQKAIKELILHEQMNKNEITLDGDYNINRNGFLYNESTMYKLEYDGENPKNGTLTFENNELKNACITINKYKVEFDSGKVIKVKKGTCSYVEIIYSEE